MGKVEKVVVLSVLFLITLILVVSLSSTPESLAQKQRVREPAPSALEGEGAQAPQKLLLGEVQPLGLAGGPGGASVAPASDAPAQPSTELTLAPGDDTGAAQSAAALPAGSILVTSQGLADSYLEEYRFYTWTAGDTWESVAEHCYGSVARAELLEQSNEGRTRIQPGEKILVPVFAPASATSAPAAVPAASPRAASAMPAPGESSAPAAKPSAAAPGAASEASTYLVVDGDTLWRIAKKRYGSGARWQEIYEANRDALPSPDALHVGQRLRIP